MKNTKLSATKTKFSPLTISLLVVLVLYVLLMLLLFYWVILSASKQYLGDYESEWTKLYPHNRIGLPKKFYLLENIVEMSNSFAGDTLAGLAMNTILYAGGCSLSKVVVTCVVAYLCARYDNWFSKLVYSIVIVTMIVPVVGSQAAEIQLAKTLNLHDQIWGMWVMRANFLGMYFLVFYGGFKSMPAGYYEAAKIDGANDMQIMCRIALPLVKYTFLSIFLIVFIEYWNDYLIPNYYLPNHRTLSLALYQQMQNGGGTKNQIYQEAPYAMTTVLLITTPVIVLFSIFSKRLMGNLSVGGLKG